MYADTNTAKDVRPHDEMHCTIYLYILMSTRRICPVPGLGSASGSPRSQGAQIRAGAGANER